MRLQLTNGRVRLDTHDPDLHLTEPQRRALEVGGEIVVTAGAGAGKTHTLAIRYVALLVELAQLGRPEIDAVAVLTFTDKAAAEMAERCYQRLLATAEAARAQRAELDHLDGPGGAPLGTHLAAALDHLCDRFDSARIGTFHGFCARILREFPVESQTALDIEVLDPVESREIARQVLDRCLLERLREEPEPTGALLDAFGSRTRALDAGLAAWSRRAELQRALGEHARGERSIEQAIDRSPWTPDHVSAWLSATGRPLLRAVERLTAPAGSTAFRTDTLVPTLASLDEPAGLGPTARALWTAGAAQRCLGALLNDAGALRDLRHHTVLGVRAAWPDRGRHAQARQALGMLAERCADWPAKAQLASELPTAADATLLEVLGPFARWVEAAHAQFAATLEERSAIDFSEMQQRAVRAVLDHPSVRQTLVARHRYLVVDEFQDTDARQWELVRALGRPDGVPADRIFLVGDAKQAIYGFRGGDVTVFRAAAAELGVDPVVLPHNFRSRSELIHWFNLAFPEVLAPAQAILAPHEAPFEDLLPGREADRGTVAVVLGAADDGGSDAQATAHLIAAEILPGRGSYAGMDLDDRTRWPEPPIAILLRRRTELAAFEEALRERAVAYQVGQGVGFWSRPEVVDLVNTLHGLATGDPSSIVGALRSPLFGLTDQQITDLVRSDPGLAGLATGAVPDQPDLTRVAAEWAELRRLVRGGSPGALLRVLADRGRLHWHSGSSLGPGREEANAARLVELAGAFDTRGGVVRCAHRFLGQVRQGTREAEATLAPGRARVVLLTIHAAKGLEFPVVLIPEIDLPPRPESGALAVGRPFGPGSWELGFAVADEESEVQRQVRPGLLAGIRRAARAEAEAEYRRLLYVAATRARDHLVLLGNHPPEGPRARESWASLLLPNLPAHTQVRTRSDVLELPIPPVGGAPARLPSPPGEPPSPPAPRLELGASSLDAFASCPARWYRRSVLGVPEHTAQPRERARNLAAIRGQVLHGLLEDEATEPEVAARRWRAAVVDAGFPLAVARDGLHGLLAHLATAADSPALARALAAPGHSELGFRVARGPVTLAGQIDRLWRHDDGWVVLDYKTEALQTSPQAQLQRRHRLQLLAYAWAADRILRANGQPPVIRAEVFFTATGDWASLPWTDGARLEVEAQLDEIARVGTGTWTEAEAEALAEEVPRPCATCGYLDAGCAGQRVVAGETPSGRAP